MSVVYGYATIRNQGINTTKSEWWNSPRVQVVKLRKWLVLAEWWVAEVWRSTPSFDYTLSKPFRLAGPFKTKEAAEAAMKLMEEN